jgi:hypothetical protein
MESVSVGFKLGLTGAELVGAKKGAGTQTEGDITKRVD